MLRFVVLCALAAFVYADCGQQSIVPNNLNKVVGGSEAVPGSWPWQVMLRTTGWKAFCGGTLIKEQWVVTATHCMIGNDPVSDVAVLGAHELNDVDATQTTVGIMEVFQHEDYNDYTLDNDISLIKLASPVAFSDYVNTACLPSSAYATGTDCVVTGWGDQKTEVYDASLQEVVVPIVSNAQCNDQFWYYGEITANMICAGYEDGGKDTCQGDSGGPLVCQRASGAWDLVGVTSWGHGCAEIRRPGVYTNVLNYVDWINGIIDNA